MNFVIFVISVFGIYCICYILNNYSCTKEKEYKSNLSITLNVDNVDYYYKKEIIEKVLCGNYENLLDIVDNIQIN